MDKFGVVTPRPYHYIVQFETQSDGGLVLLTNTGRIFYEIKGGGFVESRETQSLLEEINK